MKIHIIFCVPAQISYLGISWDMGQNALGQLDCRVFKSTISLEQSNGIAWFFVEFKIRWKFMEIKSWLKNTGLGLHK